MLQGQIDTCFLEGKQTFRKVLFSILVCNTGHQAKKLRFFRIKVAHAHFCISASSAIPLQLKAPRHGVGNFVLCILEEDGVWQVKLNACCVKIVADH